MGARGPVPSRLGPLPRAPGAPPRGGSRAQTTTATYRPTTLVGCPKLMSILMSFFGRFGDDLGSLLGGFLGLWMALGRSKLVPRPSSNRLIFENAIFQNTLRFPIENCQK